MQEQTANIEKTINSSMDEIKQKLLGICKNRYENDLDFNSATVFSHSIGNWG